MQNANVAFVAAFAVVGALVGYSADYFARRWPKVDDDYAPRRAFDLRTMLVVVTGAAAAAGLALRFGDDLGSFAVYAVLFVPLLFLLATDLDQRLLPDVVTLPMIVFAAAILLLDWSPALASKDLGFLSGVAAGIVAPVLLFVSSRVLGGGLGMGDVKLAASLGLVFGISALFYGLILASMGFALVLMVLIAVRVVGLKSFVPFGPVLIFAAFIAALAT